MEIKSDCRCDGAGPRMGVWRERFDFAYCVVIIRHKRSRSGLPMQADVLARNPKVPADLAVPILDGVSVFQIDSSHGGIFPTGVDIYGPPSENVSRL
jgi:hypothetical protein